MQLEFFSSIKNIKKAQAPTWLHHNYMYCEHHVTLEFNHFFNTNLIKQTVSNINEMKDAHKDHCSR